MRARLTLIVVALALLAFAGLRQGDQRAASPHGAASAPGHLRAQPEPEPALPAIVTAAAKGSATVETLPFTGTERATRPADHVIATAHFTRAVPAVASRPRSIPLLI